VTACTKARGGRRVNTWSILFSKLYMCTKEHHQTSLWAHRSWNCSYHSIYITSCQVNTVAADFLSLVGWVGGCDAPQNNRNLAQASVVPVQSMDTFIDLQSKEVRLQNSSFSNQYSSRSIEVKAASDSTISRVVTREEPDAFV
jgi:hypothetical protein